MDEQIAAGDGDDVIDEDMGAVEAESSVAEVGIIHEDVEDEIASVLLSQLGQSGKSCRRELRK